MIIKSGTWSFFKINFNFFDQKLNKIILKKIESNDYQIRNLIIFLLILIFLIKNGIKLFLKNMNQSWNGK